MAKEDEQHQVESGSEPVYPIPLTPDLADFLKSQRIACLKHATTEGTAFVIKLPAVEINSVRGTIPIHLRHELYQHPAAPVIRTVIGLYDQPNNPLKLETFTNIEDDSQREEFAQLANQDELLLLFYDERLKHRLSKRVGNIDGETIEGILTQADAVRQRIPDEEFDFDRAKADVIERTPM